MQSPAARALQAELHRSSGAKKRRHQDDKGGMVRSDSCRLYFPCKVFQKRRSDEAAGLAGRFCFGGAGTGVQTHSECSLLQFLHPAGEQSEAGRAPRKPT
jgi:hypothetical protein